MLDYLVTLTSTTAGVTSPISFVATGGAGTIFSLPVNANATYSASLQARNAVGYSSVSNAVAVTLRVALSAHDGVSHAVPALGKVGVFAAAAGIAAVYNAILAKNN